MEEFAFSARESAKSDRREEEADTVFFPTWASSTNDSAALQGPRPKGHDFNSIHVAMPYGNIGTHESNCPQITLESDALTEHAEYGDGRQSRTN